MADILRANNISFAEPDNEQRRHEMAKHRVSFGRSRIGAYRFIGVSRQWHDTINAAGGADVSISHAIIGLASSPCHDGAGD